MAYIMKNTPKSAKIIQPPPVVKKDTFKLPYDMPEEYRNKFYLANAALFDKVNWFLHNAYETFFKCLRYDLHHLEENKTCTIDESIDKLNNIISLLDKCNGVIDIQFPIKKDKGGFELVRGFKGQYGLATGLNPTLGGFRFDEDLTRDKIKGLSALTMYKNSCMGVGLAGSNGGIKINPKNYSENELRNMVKQYAAEMFQKGVCGGKSDISHPDINTSQREMNWISNTFAEFTGCQINTASMGKGIMNDGLPNFDKAASLGAYYAIDFFINNEELMQQIELTTGLKDKSFIIQGLGKIGAPLALQLVDMGAICVGVKEKEAYYYDANGINLKELYEHIKNTGSMKNYLSTKPVENSEIYKKNCDLLILASGHKCILCYDASYVKAKLIVEAADAPMTPSAHKVLTTASKLVIPDIYACTGTTIASYMEYLQNLQVLNINVNNILKDSHEVFTDVYKTMSVNVEKRMVAGSGTETVTTDNATLLPNTIKTILTQVGQNIINYAGAHKLGLDLKTAAYIISLDRMYKKIFAEKKYI